MCWRSDIKRSRAAAAVAVVMAAAVPNALAAQAGAWTLELEAGPAWQSYNDVEVPNDGSATPR
jgi:hypothetical protein